jgi:ribose transport system substrate-binding protein
MTWRFGPRKRGSLMTVSGWFSRRGVALSLSCSALAAALALTSCGGSGSSTTRGSSAQKPIHVGLFMASVADGYTRALSQAVAQQAKAMGGTSQLFTATFDPQKQLQQCQDAIVTRKYQAFIIQPVDGPSMVSCARQAINDGIKVVAVSNPIGPNIDTTAPQVKGITGTILESPSTMGKALANLTVDACKPHNPCKVIYEFGPANFSFAANTRKVFKQEIAKHPSITVVAEGSHEFIPDKARSLTKQFLVAHPDVNVITSDDDPSAAALLGVVDQMGLQKKIAVIGGAGAKDGAVLVASGKMFGSAVLVPRTAGKKATEIAIKAARGENPGRTQFNNAQDLSPIGPMLTKQNSGQFKAQWSASD